MKLNYAPIVLFVYNRAHHTAQTIAALQANPLAQHSDLFIYADGPREASHKKGVDEVRECINNIEGFKKVTVITSEFNKGLTQSIVDGVSDVVNQYGRVVVIEDDVVVSSAFLDYVNTALDYYQNNKRVWHVAGWGYPTRLETDKDVYFSRLMKCWGWATWSDRWVHYQKDEDAMYANYDKARRKRFNIDGYDRIWNQVEANKNGKINTWDVFWYATIFEQDGLCLCPTKSFVKNIGHGDGTHCKDSSFEDNSDLNINKNIRFESLVVEDVNILRQIKQHLKTLKKGSFARFKLYLRTNYDFFV